MIVSIWRSSPSPILTQMFLMSPISPHILRYAFHSAMHGFLNVRQPSSRPRAVLSSMVGRMSPGAGSPSVYVSTCSVCVSVGNIDSSGPWQNIVDFDNDNGSEFHILYSNILIGASFEKFNNNSNLTKINAAISCNNTIPSKRKLTSHLQKYSLRNNCSACKLSDGEKSQ